MIKYGKSNDMVWVFFVVVVASPNAQACLMPRQIENYMTGY